MQNTPILSVIMPGVIMPSVIMPSVIMLIVVAQKIGFKSNRF